MPNITADAFAALIPSMTERDKAFALSLLSSYRGRGVSEKQAYWIDTLAARVTSPKTAEVGIDLAPLAVLCRTAKASGLQFPKVLLAYEGCTYKISLAGAASRNAGCLYVKLDGTYCGKITPEGTYHGKPEAVKALRHFSADPAKAAAEYGKLTGCCSFCRRPLTDARSVAVGYGEICAGRYGLPWGEVALAA